MKNVILNNRALKALILAGSLMMSAFSAQANLVLFLEDNDVEVIVNETFTLDLFVDVDVPVNSIISWGLDIDFDNSIIGLNSFTLGDSFVALPFSDDSIGGSAALPPGVFGSRILLGSFEFTALATGLTSVSTSNTLGDLFEGFTTTNFFAPVTFNSASANVSVVSAPATFSLLLIAGLAVFGLRRKA